MRTKCSGMDVNENPAMSDVFELMADGMGCGVSTDWSVRGRFFPVHFSGFSK